MVEVSMDESGYIGQILLQPHISLSWRNNLRIFLLLSFITLLVAFYFLQKGAWLVLPFSGLELLVIFTSMMMFFRRFYCCEIICFSEDSIVIEHGHKKIEQSYKYQRHWSKFHIQEKSKSDTPKIFIKSHGKEFELGSFLCRSEKIVLINTLKDITNKFISSTSHSHENIKPSK